jgi:protein involved in polysaccharide export with SLBB domain
MKTKTFLLPVAAICAAAALSITAAEPAQTTTPSQPRPIVTATNLNDMPLMPADKMLFKIEEDPVKVSDPCVVAVPPLGQVHFPVSRGYDELIMLQVKGRTVEEVKKELKAKLEEKFYKTATVNLTLVSTTTLPGKATFFGSIKGFVTLTPGVPTYLTEAIAERGYTEFANLSKVEIDRVNPDDPDKPKKIYVNVEAIMKNRRGERNNDVVLQDGDRITVKDRWWNL